MKKRSESVLSMIFVLLKDKKKLYHIQEIFI